MLETNDLFLILASKYKERLVWVIMGRVKIRSHLVDLDR